MTQNSIPLLCEIMCFTYQTMTEVGFTRSCVHNKMPVEMNSAVTQSPFTN